MSDPVTQADVEDVLSSIRRLVSDDGQKVSNVQTKRRAPVPRLVLTPALRVADDTDPTPPPADTPRAEAFDLSQYAEPQQGLSVVSDAREPQTPLTPEAPWQDPDATLFAMVQDAAPEDAVSDMPLDGPQVNDTALGAPVSEPTVPNASQKAAAVVQKIAEMEAATGFRSAFEGWEPDERNTPPFAETSRHTVPWQDPSEVASSATDFSDELCVEDAVTNRCMSRVTETVDDSVLDEEALRELVAQTVREELQGVLGERITRNVRKLVHREIQRALAARDLR